MISVESVKPTTGRAASLLLLSLGPVQDFIAAARRCQDLWYGSYMLSELSRAAAEAVKAACGVDDALIFPGALNNDKAAVANKILARVPTGVDPAAVAKAARDAMGRRLKHMADTAWPAAGDPYFNRERAERQLDELMELFWVSVPSAGDYPAALVRAETLLAARKVTKSWSAQGIPGDGVGVPKSSLDGLRESVIAKEAYKKYGRQPEQLRRRYGIKNGKEQLCGVALLKRMGVENATTSGASSSPAFHSTSHMAAAPLLVRFARQGTDVSGYLPEARTRIRSGEQQTVTLTPPADLGYEAGEVEVPRTFAGGSDGFDGAVFFEDRLAQDFFPERWQRDELRDAEGALRNHLKGITPVPYYAMLLADGDSMGAHLKTIAKGPDGWRAHQEFSQKLDAFAVGARKLVEGFGGSLVYSGGDDVMALLPLHTALACADALRQSFTATLAEHEGSGMTLSVGLAFMHHLVPMDRARRMAKQAERAAKDDAGRDALAIVLDKRSGVTLTIHDKWSGGLHTRLDQWAGLIRSEGLPNGVAYELERMLATFEHEPPYDDGEVAAIKALARQIIARKRANRGADDMNKDVVKQLEETFERSGDPKKAIATLSGELQVARLLLAAYNVAWGPLTGGVDHE